jgi:hypothetical protein
MEIDVNTPEFKSWMKEFDELHDRIVQVRCRLNEIGEIIAWCERHDIGVKLRNHWSEHTGGVAAFELRKETYTEEKKVLFMLRWL